ncbi:MAG: hypothetical protein HY549_09920 [Elusimicrobia bacterium]|nr:hypothetical protein [Elusimicrobiota bacterium]
MSWSRVLGQERAIRTLRGFLTTRRRPPTLLMAGPDGVGKKLAALEWARALLCGRQDAEEESCGSCPDCQAVEQSTHPDLKRVDAAYQASLREDDPGKQRTIRVETIRQLRKDMSLESWSGRWKVAILEDAHTLEIEAANALLKILEEPPQRTAWVLLSSRRQALPQTVLSRCFTVRFSPLSEELVRTMLGSHGLEPEAARQAAALCDGSASRALALAQRGSLPSGPMAPFLAADALPKELHLARGRAELEIYALTQSLRLKLLSGDRVPGLEGPLSDLLALSRALRTNADPRLALTLAYFAAEATR